MKKALSLLFVLLIQINQLNAQDVSVQTLYGETKDFDDLLSGEKDQVVVLFTWAAKWCWPCVKTLNEYNKSHEDLVSKYNIKFSALNLDTEYTNSEIKKFTNESDWKFDVYTDPNGNFLKIMESSAAPDYFILINGKVKLIKSGFLDGTGNPETTADFIVEVINDIYSNRIYFDEDWNFTTKKYASFVRYRDKVGDTYEVTDRWLTGEKQMSGTYSDFWCAKEIGKFTWYDKDGTISSTKNYDEEEITTKIPAKKTPKQIMQEKGLSNFQAMNFEYNIKLKSFKLSKYKFEKIDDKYHYYIPFYATDNKSFAFLIKSENINSWSITNNAGEFIPKSFKQFSIKNDYLLNLDGSKSIQSGDAYIFQGGDLNLRQELMRGKQCYLKLIYTEEQYNNLLDKNVNIGYYEFDNESELNKMKDYLNQFID